jgi:hypothetical protein
VISLSGSAIDGITSYSLGQDEINGSIHPSIAAPIENTSNIPENNTPVSNTPDSYIPGTISNTQTVSN